MFTFSTCQHNQYTFQTNAAAKCTKDSPSLYILHNLVQLAHLLNQNMFFLKFQNFKFECHRYWILKILNFGLKVELDNILCLVQLTWIFPCLLMTDGNIYKILKKVRLKICMFVFQKCINFSNMYILNSKSCIDIMLESY
jgi:hypothetical protein